LALAVLGALTSGGAASAQATVIPNNNIRFMIAPRRSVG
jgi:hypothetical protein